MPLSTTVNLIERSLCSLCVAAVCQGCLPSETLVSPAVDSVVGTNAPRVLEGTNTPTVLVRGEVAKQGTITFHQGMTAWEAIREAGGSTPYAGHIRVVRDSDLLPPMKPKDAEAFVLHAGDFVLVMQR